MRHRRHFFPGAALFMLLSQSCAAPPGGNEVEAEAPPTSAQASQLVEPENWWDVLPRPGYSELDKVGVFENWFEVYRLRDDTFALYEPYQFQEAISYLLLGSERALLIDSGNGIGNIRRAASQLTDLDITVALTHEHLDHFGGSHLFQDVAIYNVASAIERVGAGVPHDRASRTIREGYVWKPLPNDVDPETFVIPGASVTQPLSDGQLLDLGDRTIEVIHTPGHSPGSTCYLDRDNRLLFTGDHFYPGPLYAHTGDVDLEQYVASNEKLVSRIAEYDHVLSGHNEPWVEAAVIPRVSQAFRTIFAGEGEFGEDGDLRRYRFDGFDILIRTTQLPGRASP